MQAYYVSIDDHEKTTTLRRRLRLYTAGWMLYSTIVRDSDVYRCFMIAFYVSYPDILPSSSYSGPPAQVRLRTGTARRGERELTAFWSLLTEQWPSVRIYRH